MRSIEPIYSALERTSHDKNVKVLDLFTLKYMVMWTRAGLAKPY
jgi:hypothetical protein